MDKEVLKVLLDNRGYDFFLIETRDLYYNSALQDYEEMKELVIIALSNELDLIRNEKTYDTFLLKDTEIFENVYIDENIYIYPEILYFQKYCRILKKAIDCIPISGNDITKLICKQPKSLSEAKKILEEK